MIDIKAIAKAKTFKKIGKKYKTYEEFEKAFEETWDTLMGGKKKDDGKSAD
jgi:hypothetical protein